MIKSITSELACLAGCKPLKETKYLKIVIHQNEAVFYILLDVIVLHCIVVDCFDCIPYI